MSLARQRCGRGGEHRPRIVITLSPVLFLLFLLLLTVIGVLFSLNNRVAVDVVVDAPLKVGATNHQRRPRLVWHVGPMKTGTTTLQLALREWSNNNASTKNDHQLEQPWVYLGPSAFMKGSRAIPNLGAGITDADFPERFAKLLRSYDKDGADTNVVVSSEYFSIEYRAEHYRAVAHSLSKNHLNWDVQLVIGYRPYYEWIPSRYSQAHKATPQQRNHRGDPYPWKDALGRRWKHPVRPMFPTYYDAIEAEHIFADDVYQYAAPFFHNVTILSLQPDLVQKFFCDILRQTSSSQQQQQHEIAMANPSRLTSIRSDAIALGAAARGMIDIQHYTRTEIMEAVEREIVSTAAATTTAKKKQLYLVCPEQVTLDRVWEQTVNKEARLFYPSSSSIGETKTTTTMSTPRLPKQRIEQLWRGFQQYVDDQTLCHVNVTAVLEDPEWRQFLAPFGRAENRG